MVSGGEQSGYGILTVREQLWMFSQFYGLGTREGWRRTDELIDLVGLAEQRLPARQRALHRPAPEAQPGPGPRQRPVDPLPRRADPGPRRRRGARRPRPLPQLAGGGPRADGPPHHPLHGRGRRALRPGRDRRSRAASWPSARRPSSSGASRRSPSSGSRSTACPAGPAPGPAARRPLRGRREPPRDRRRRAGRPHGRASPWPTTRPWPAWSAALAGAGAHLRGLAKSEPTLEDVFVELVGRGLDEARRRTARARRARPASVRER